jgi:hypothetical protein
MSSKYRNKQKRKAAQVQKRNPYNSEWDAMLFLVDFGVESEYQGEVFIPHDHLPQEALGAVDYLVALGYVPTAMDARPLGLLTSEYLKDGANIEDIPK